MKHVRDTSRGREVAIILAKDASNLCGCSVLIVGCGFDDHGDTARRIALVNDLIEVLRLVALARATFDCALNVIVRHALRACHLDRTAQTRVPARIATTCFRGDGDFLRQLAEDLAAFRVDRAFETLDLRPFTVSRHGAEFYLMLCLTKDADSEKRPARE